MYTKAYAKLKRGLNMLNYILDHSLNLVKTNHAYFLLKDIIIDWQEPKLIYKDLKSKTNS